MATSNLSSADTARDVAEAARQTDWLHPSFVKELFLGHFRFDLIHPHPVEDPQEAARALPFLNKLKSFLATVDSEAIDQSGHVPESVVQTLREMGAFGIKIPEIYGGLGLSPLSYVRAMEMVASKDGALTALLSAHQSIGLPQPLVLFGTEEQKQTYLPRLAKGAISAFALTEVNAGSDPSNLECTATPTEDGQHYRINGEKLWCTNGSRAELLVVMAQTPPVSNKSGEPQKQITAFIVETNSPGVELVKRLNFMGLKGMENGLLKFTDVLVPKENIILGLGRGLKLALVTLNTGRLSLPACATGSAKSMLRYSRAFAGARVQWGQPVGRHEAIGQKLAHMTSDIFAMESIAELSALLYQSGHHDIRLEAAMAKMLNTEKGWRIVDDALQIHGGRGYETATSQSSRGVTPIPIERAMRDFRINLIFEGSSEIMRLFIAREAVDHHFKMAFNIVKPGVPLSLRFKTLLKAIPFYLTWYPGLWFPKNWRHPGPLASHLGFLIQTTPRLGRAVFHAMLRFGPKLEKRQAVLFRLVDIGSELFAMSATCSRALMLQHSEPSCLDLADLYCQHASERIELLFQNLYGPTDKLQSKISGQVLEGQYAWLEQGIF